MMILVMLIVALLMKHFVENYIPITFVISI